jgi:hypothetical protein
MNVVYNIATFEKELIMKYKYDANEVIPTDMTKQVHVELTNGYVTTANGSNIEWGKDGCFTVVSWEYAVVYDHTEMKSNHVDGDWYQYSRGGIRWFDIQNPPFYSDVQYRKHPHNELMKSYVDGDVWQRNSGYGWVILGGAPAWCDDSVVYRKHPHSDLIKSYVDGDKWEYSIDGSRWRECALETPLWKDDLMYRKHQHSDSIREYKKGEQWQFTYVDNPDDGDWIDCKNEPQWDDTAAYRKKSEPKKPEPEIIKLCRFPGSTTYFSMPRAIGMVEETFQRIK